MTQVRKGSDGQIGIWRDLETRFRALQPKHDDGLRANWISTAWNDVGDQWRLSGSQDRRVPVVFTWIAVRAALRLGHVGGPTALFFWLDLLKRESPNFRSGTRGSSRPADGAEMHYEGGTIYRLCEASADYCLKFENEEVATTKRHAIGRLEPVIELATEPQKQPVDERTGSIRYANAGQEGLVDSRLGD